MKATCNNYNLSVCTAPPAGVKRVEWRLITNRGVDSLGHAAELIGWYRARWEIEMFFNLLKSGCPVEALQLASLRKTERALALYMIVAWRINRLMRLGRTRPDLPADLLFETEEWQAAFVLNKLPVLTSTHSIAAFGSRDRRPICAIP